MNRIHTKDIIIEALKVIDQRQSSLGADDRKVLVQYLTVQHHLHQVREPILGTPVDGSTIRNCLID